MTQQLHTVFLYKYTKYKSILKETPWLSLLYAIYYRTMSTCISVGKHNKKYANTIHEGPGSVLYVYSYMIN